MNTKIIVFSFFALKNEEPVNNFSTWYFHFNIASRLIIFDFNYPSIFITLTVKFFLGFNFSIFKYPLSLHLSFWERLFNESKQCLYSPVGKRGQSYNRYLSLHNKTIFNILPFELGRIKQVILHFFWCCVYTARVHVKSFICTIVKAANIYGNIFTWEFKSNDYSRVQYVLSRAINIVRKENTHTRVSRNVWPKTFWIPLS